APIRLHLGMEDYGVLETGEAQTYSRQSSMMHLICASNLGDDIVKRLELMEAYDTTLELRDYSNDPDLWSVLSLHPEEDPVTGGRTLNLMDELVTLRLPEATNMSLIELMRLPPFALQHL